MNYSFKELITMVLLVSLAFSMFTMLFTDIAVSASFQKEAVIKGYAHWEPKPSDGSMVFTWNK